MSTKFEVKLRCKVCGHRYKRVMAAESVEALDALPVPKCPACSKAERNIGMDYSINRAPGIVGGNIAVRAIDETARIVMEDHKLTDLRSDVREGETAAPKLAPHLQAQADGFFGGGKKLPVNPGMLRAAALSGAFRPGTPDVVATLHRKKERPPVNFVAGDGIKGGVG